MSSCSVFKKILKISKLHTNDITISKHLITATLVHKFLRVKGLSTLLIEMVNIPNNLFL